MRRLGIPGGDLAALFGVAALAATGPAFAVDLPVQGTFGMTSDDCKAAKDENEGGYVFFEKNTTGEGGQGGCTYSAVTKTGPNSYALTGSCKPLEGRAKRRTVKLVVTSPTAITYDDADYKRCPK